MAATNIGNVAGYVPVFDGGNPRIVGGFARNAIISGGVFCFASGAAGVVSSGINSFATADVLFAADASGGQFNGVAVNTSTVSGTVAIATRAVIIAQCNGGVTAGTLVKCDGNNSVATLGATEGEQTIGRALTEGASGGFALIDIHG